MRDRAPLDRLRRPEPGNVMGGDRAPIGRLYLIGMAVLFVLPFLPWLVRAARYLAALG